MIPHVTGGHKVAITSDMLERRVYEYIKKWLRLPQRLSKIGLYGNGALIKKMQILQSKAGHHHVRHS